MLEHTFYKVKGVLSPPAYWQNDIDKVEQFFRQSPPKSLKIPHKVYCQLMLICAMSITAYINRASRHGFYGYCEHHRDGDLGGDFDCCLGIAGGNRFGRLLGDEGNSYHR